MTARTKLVALLILLAGVLPALANSVEEIPRRIYETVRIGEAPLIDGVLDDRVWDLVAWSGDFVQRDPDDGAPPSQASEFKVVYDDNALYFAFRLHDDPEKVDRKLARRDWFPGDWIEVNIDSYYDRRTAFSFTISCSETRGDEFISNDGDNWNTSWNPVWNGATQIDDRGWTAETRVPLSQLRFSGAPEQTWGLQVQRRVFRLEERSTWQRIPKDSSGWVSQFGELRGLRDLNPKRNFELVPYGVASADRFEAEEGNPFSDGQDTSIDIGLDGKLGVTNNLTLDFTVNPDFGQVEADPSQVNLSAFETFFREQRPFFIEGNEILDLRVSPASTGGSFTRDNLFYSRRIGRRPIYDPDDAYVDSPNNTTILGAFKLSGKTANGLSIGILDSVTSRERAEVDDGFGNRDNVTVEPMTNYFAGRLQQDFQNGDTQFGGMVTAVNRDISDPQLEFMPEQAYAGGLDFGTYFKDRDYRLEATLLGSTLRGSQEAIFDAQTSSARYFQRPDNDSASLDPTRTTLSGSAGSLRFSRTSNHDLMFQSGVTWRSPGFEINDLGFMRSADQINQFNWIGYRKRNPFSVFDNWSLNGNVWLDWDYAGNFLGDRYNTNTHATFRNKYRVGGGITRTEENVSNTALRGGPSLLRPGQWSYDVYMNSDQRKNFTYNMGGFVAEGDSGSSDYEEAWLSLAYRPTNALRISLRPSYSHNQPELQYVDTQSFGKSERYLMGSLDQETIQLTIRLDYSITPNLTVQFYGAPFLSTGSYDAFKRVTNPRTAGYVDRFSTFDANQIAFNAGSGEYDVDENVDGNIDYNIADPDFEVRDFNSNLVVRWEYSPGSTVYFVWSQTRSNSDTTGQDLDFSDGLDALFSSHPENIVLVKVSKWFGR